MVISNQTSSVDLDAPADAIDDNEDTSATDLPVKPWNPKDIRITTKTFTIREIYTQITGDELELAPDFQRAFVWKDAQQVRLVESVLLGIPLPAFYFNQDDTGAHQVIDGVQRLTTIRRFMSNGLALAEGHLEYLKSLSGLKFDELDPATRRRFGGTQIVAHVIEPQTPDDVKYDIFNRVNTGGSPLTAQEIRHCMSKAASRHFLKELVNLPSFKTALGDVFRVRDPDGFWTYDNKRMLDRELALRFCAFRTVPVTEYIRFASLEAFLLDFTRHLDKMPGNDGLLRDLQRSFDRAMRNCYEILGKGAFRLWPIGGRRGPLNRAIFESQAIALCEYEPKALLPYKERIQEALRELFNDDRYDSAVRTGTGDSRKVDLRLDKAREAVRKVME